MGQVNIIISFIGISNLIHIGNHTSIKTSNSGYRSLSNEFDLENSDIWPTATTQYSDYLSNRGYRLNSFAKRRKSRQIEPTSSDERIDGKRIRFFSLKNLVLNKKTENN